MFRSLARRAALVATLTALMTGVVALSSPPAQADPGDDLSVYVLTFGPGDHPFFKFGHNAIWIQPRGGQGWVFNFGTFQFSDDIILKFLKGRMMYWLSVSPIEDTVAGYQEENRTIEAQELDLTPAERLTLFTRLRDNAHPDKRAYLYDYFWDNCSTRVRDAVDGVVGGRLRGAGTAPARMSFRQHALRMTADAVPVYTGLHFGLGSLTDVPLDMWREAFLPERLRDLLRMTTVVRDGAERPLVKSERVLFKAVREPVRSEPPAREPVFLVIGLLVGGGLLALGANARRRPWARRGFGAALVMVGFVLGLLGLILVFLWMLTDHKAAHANANIFLCAPFALWLVGSGIGVARGRPTSARRAWFVVAGALVLAVLGLLVKLVPGPIQDNTAFVLLLLPIWAGLAFGLRRMLLVRTP